MSRHDADGRREGEGVPRIGRGEPGINVLADASFVLPAYAGLSRNPPTLVLLGVSVPRIVGVEPQYTD